MTVRRTIEQKWELRRRSLYRRAVRRAPLLVDQIVRGTIAARPDHYGPHDPPADLAVYAPRRRTVPSKVRKLRVRLADEAATHDRMLRQLDAVGGWPGAIEAAARRARSRRSALAVEAEAAPLFQAAE